MNKITKSNPVATLAQAKHRLEELRQEYQNMKGAWFDLGRKADQAIRAGDLHALGVNLGTWIAEWALDGEGRSTIYDSLKIVKDLAALPEATVRRMSKVNAIELCKLPPSKRLDVNWVRSAQVRTTREFKDMVRSERNGKEPSAEEWRSVRLPAAVAEQIEEALAKIARILLVDIEREPGRKIQCWEAMARLVLDTHESHLKVELVGGSAEDEAQ